MHLWIIDMWNVFFFLAIFIYAFPVILSCHAHVSYLQGGEKIPKHSFVFLGNRYYSYRRGTEYHIHLCVCICVCVCTQLFICTFIQSRIFWCGTQRLISVWTACNAQLRWILFLVHTNVILKLCYFSVILKPANQCVRDFIAACFHLAEVNASRNELAEK